MRRAIRHSVTALLVLGLLEGASQRKADLLLDHSPATTGANLLPQVGVWSNMDIGQNFGEHFGFSSTEFLTGMDIYTRSEWPSLGMLVTVRLWADAAGLPGTLLYEFNETVSAVDSVGTVAGNDNVRVHADITYQLALAANTIYWIGMSGGSVDGNSHELGLLGLGGTNAPDDGSMAQFSGNAGREFVSINSSVGDMAFRLEGSTIPTSGDAPPERLPLPGVVPEPSSLVVGGSIVLVGLALAWRRSKDQVPV
jgi:hypothetical protein